MSFDRSSGSTRTASTTERAGDGVSSSMAPACPPNLGETIRVCEPVVGAILARDFGCSAAFPALPSRSAGPPDSAPVPKRGATRHFKEKARSVRRSSSRASRGKERVLAAEVLLALGIALVAVFAGLGFRILNLAWQALADLRDRLEEDQ